MSSRGSRSSTRTVPFDGLASPQSMRNIVDFPAPFGPSRAVTPGPTSKLTSETATSAPNHLETFSATTRGSVIGIPRDGDSGASRPRAGQDGGTDTRGDEPGRKRCHRIGWIAPSPKIR